MADDDGLPRGEDAAEDLVDGYAGFVLAVGPEVAVGVEGFGGGVVAEAALDDLHGAAFGNEEAGVEVAEIVERRPLREAGRGAGAVPHLDWLRVPAFPRAA